MVISVPRIVYVSTRNAIESESAEVKIRKVEKHLPHSKTAKYLYEVTMSENFYRREDWVGTLRRASPGSRDSSRVDIDQIYETATPLLMRALTELGSVSKLSNTAQSRKVDSYQLSDLKRVDRPADGPYLASKLFRRRAFLYVRLNPKTRSGIVALYTVDKEQNDCDITAPSEGKPGTFDISSSCQIWIWNQLGKQTIETESCERVFSQLLQAVQASVDLDSDYLCISPTSLCTLNKMEFFKSEEKLFDGVSKAITSFARSSSNSCILVANTNRPLPVLRNRVPALNNVPVVPLPFPPGPDHGPSMATLPALNWELPAVQLCFEAYLYMGVVSYPKRVAFARYGNLPVGNLGEDVDFTLYEVSLARTLQRNRALSWASPWRGAPDLGAPLLASGDGKLRPSIKATGENSADVWGDDDELVSPVVRKPGCYRTVCVDIDVHDLAVAALTDMAALGSSATGPRPEANDPSSPTSVLQLGNGAGAESENSGPLGDEMSMSTALPMLRALVGAWLKDAFTTNNEIADSMLHHVYRLVSNPNTLMHDPALHRVVHSLMKSTFMRLLNELQRLGCTIVYATFHRITIATNKIGLADAEEHVNFVISTVQRKCLDSEEQSSLARVALRPRQFHTQYLFMDEYNYGTLTLERRDKDILEQGEYCVEEEANSCSVVVPSVVTAWSIMNYLGSDIAKEYFRVIIGRFSREALKKQVEIQNRNEAHAMMSVFCKDMREELLQFRQKMVSKHFASYLTRAVAEIAKDFNEQSHSMPGVDNPVLEFIKSVMTVLELDQEVDAEVHVLKRSLLAQVGVAEYSSLATWENPCPTFMLPDVFCVECRESRDLNLCYVPPSVDEDEGKHIHWFCDDCGTEYDTEDIERRLVKHVHQRMMRYQMQDIRCSMTSRVATHTLARVSTSGADFKLDISPESAESELRTLSDLAHHHELDELYEITRGMLSSFSR